MYKTKKILIDKIEEVGILEGESRIIGVCSTPKNTEQDFWRVGYAKKKERKKKKKLLCTKQLNRLSIRLQNQAKEFQHKEDVEIGKDETIPEHL